MNLDDFKNRIFTFQTYFNEDTIFILKEKMGTRLFDGVYDKLNLTPMRMRIEFENSGEIKTSSLHYSNRPMEENFYQFIKNKKIILLIKDPLQRLASGIYESYIHGGNVYQLYYSSLNYDNVFNITEIINKYNSDISLSENEVSELEQYIKSILRFCLIDYSPISDNHFQKYHKPFFDFVTNHNIKIDEVYTTDSFFTNEVSNHKFNFNINFNNTKHSWLGKKDIVIKSIGEYISDSESFRENYNKYMQDEKTSYEYFLKLNG